uniref:MFS domain-containing protein n=1 Tax=Caenorhabditis tropicalis TaxID=1561998 RepID=A0A1I7UF52_9PELO
MLKRPGEYEPPLGKIWTRAESRTWTITMFSGTCVLYAARASLPICAAAVAKEFAWNKTDSGTVLSCFFWGYALTQVFAGRIADKYGAEKILPYSSLAWTMITFFTPHLFDFAYWTNYPLVVLLAIRILTGVCQAFHIPSLASIVSKHLAAADKGRVFGIVLAGSHWGTVLAGAIGSILIEWIGWRSLFQFVGILSLIWCWVFRWVLDRNKGTGGGRSSPQPDEEVLLDKKHDTIESHLSANTPCPSVPWGTLFRHPAFWAAAVAQYTGGNSYSILFNWLPSYFHETFPTAKGVVYNVVPSLAIVVTSLVAPVMASRALAEGKTVTYTRKLMEGASLIGIAFCLMLVPMTSSFWLSLLIFTMAMAARGLHHGGVSVNPHDFAPNHAGSVFGVFNACGAITGFVGVYIAGHILEATNNNWSYVFIVTAAQCVVGAMVYTLLGTGQKII